MAASCTSYQVTNIGITTIIVEYTGCVEGPVNVALAAGDTMNVCASVAPKPNVSLQIDVLENCDPCYTCPQGTVLEGNECVSTEIIAANYTGNTFPVVAGDKSIAYSKFGIRLYPDISAFALPLYAYGTNATYALYQNDGAGAVIAPIAGVQSNLWGCDGVSNPTCGTYATGGRLNKVGVWATGYPDDTELPFTFCVDLNNTKQYLIGIGGDNKIKIYIDNVLYVYLDATDTLHGVNNSSVTRPFIHWHVFPVTLPAGNHTIKVVGLNIDTTRSFGAELYDIDLPTFQATLLNPAVSTPNCGNVEADLAPYLIFSTGDYVGMSIPDPNDPLGTWNCPDGYSLDECTGAPNCTLITAVDASPCCYKLTLCTDPLLFYYTQENLAAFVGQILQLGGLACYYVTLNTSEECIDPIVGLDITGAFASCIECLPFFALKDCATGNVVQINGMDAYFEVQLAEHIIPNPDFFLNRQILTLETKTDTWEGCGYFEQLFSDPGDTISWTSVITLTETAIPTEQSYALTNCSNGQIIYTSAPEMVEVAGTGKAIKIVGNSDCWTVEETDNCCLVLVDVTLDKCFDDCIACLETLPCICTILTNTGVSPTPFRYIDCEGVQRSIVVTVGSSTSKMCVRQWLPGGTRTIQEFGECVNGLCPQPAINPRIYEPEWNPSHCSEEHILETSCKFGAMMHDRMMARRFKIETCCPETELGITVDYELLQLELMTHPGVCDSIIDLGCICLSLNNGINPIQYITLCADPTNVFYTSISGDTIARYVPQRCRWELYLVQNNVEVLYQTIGSQGLPPTGTWTPLDPPLDSVVITSAAGSCV